MNSKELRMQAEQLFEKRMPLLRLLQEIAENFYPERADFAVKRYLGQDFASNLMTSYPLLCRRDLGDSIATMLRDMRKPWFETITTDPTRDTTQDAKAWLQWATGVQRRVMYDPDAMFQKNAKLGDHDFAAFGMNVMQVRMNGANNGLTYKLHHLRDVVWMEDENGRICMIVRRWKPHARDLVNKFKANPLRPKNSVDSRVAKIAQKKPFEEIDCMHIVCAADMFTGEGKGNKNMPWRSIYYDCMHDHEMESIAVKRKEYVISRWQCLGSQYAMSPAVVCALPEARLLQSMTFTLMEAGEKIVSPSMIAVEQAVRSDVDLSSGGITWIDYEFAQNAKNNALSPLQTDAKGMPIGRDMMGDSRNMLAQCFYLNKIKPFVPTTDPTMTAFQAGQIVAQYVRDALPLFEPMEAEYNGGICKETFECILDAGGFGPVQDMPPELQGADIDFRFQSPLHDMIESQKGQKFLEMGQLIAQAMALDKTVAALPKADVALRDALDGIQVPAKWLRSDTEVKAAQAQEAAAAAAQQQIATMQGGADVAATLGGAVKDMSAAQPMPAAA
jgi:hypothetical protein